MVVTDRYIDSAIAYQGAGRDLGSREVADIQMWAVDGLVPNLTVVLDVRPATGRSRRGDVHDRLEAEGDDFHEAVRKHFLPWPRPNPTATSSSTPPCRPSEIHARVVARLRGHRVAGGWRA